MLIIETEKKLGDSISNELKVAGLPTAYGTSTRRTINGVVKKGYPRAFTIDVDESQRATVQAVLDAHVPNFGHVDRKILETKAHASKRINERMPEWKQRNYLAFSLEVTRKENAGETITAEENATITFIEGEWAFAKSVREASDLMEVEILALTDEAAGEYNVIDNVLWP